MDLGAGVCSRVAASWEPGRKAGAGRWLGAIIAIAWTLIVARGAAAQEPEASSIERGRYLVRIGGCNDCHTAGYPQSGGDVPESRWLTGNAVGFQGPWGVSYPANLRLRLQEMNEEQWMAAARAPRLPPMPWFNLRDMSDADLRSIYAYVRALGPAGKPTPMSVPPGSPVATQVIVFVPQDLADSKSSR
jgi:mono/diheme cytochrome c family protein